MGGNAMIRKIFCAVGWHDWSYRRPHWRECLACLAWESTAPGHRQQGKPR